MTAQEWSKMGARAKLEERIKQYAADPEHKDESPSMIGCHFGKTGEEIKKILEKEA